MATKRYEFPRVPAAEVGIAPHAVLDLLRDWQEKGLELHSFMLLRQGKVAAEGYWHPYRAGDVHMLNSLSKSFTSTAILFAIQEGILSPDDAVVSFFPERAANLKISEKMRRLTLRHLLSMCTGHEPSADFIFAEHDCVSAFLESEIQGEPGGRFSYNTGATFMLSAALQAKTGQNLVDFLRPRLFEPLGMSEDIWSDMTPDGICYGGFGLNVTTDDIARLGMLYLNRGEFAGKRILAPELIDEATRRHISNRADAEYPTLDHPVLADDSVDIDPTSDWGMGYGWQFWRCIPEGIYRGDGAFGQFCIVMPRQDAVLAITAGTDDMQGILHSVWDRLLPGIGGTPSDEGQAELDVVLSGLSLPPAEGSCRLPAAADIDGAQYNFEFRGTPFTARFKFDGDVLCIATEVAGRTYEVMAGYGRHIHNNLGFTLDERTYKPPFRFMIAPDFAASWAWNKTGALVVKFILTKYAYTETAVIKFDGNKASASFKMNLAVEPPMPIEGTRA
ncbi:MAG: serine hydrolase domain-containing protein [Eubacteriales bacterium]|nr:serine hydrolase [Clostridiales bacterium]